MAWLQADPSGNYHISFRFGGQKFKRSLKTKSEQNATARRVRLEETIRLVESGRIDVPAEVDIASFLLSDGKNPKRRAVPRLVRLGDLMRDFFDAVPDGSLEDTTINGMQIHRRHLVKHLGERFPVQRLAVDDLQRYVNTRSREDGIRGRKVGGNTINKEIVTFRSVWNWGVDTGRLKGEFPRKGVRLPKEVEKPPFQTWTEIERQIERGGLTAAEQAELWDCLFLTLDEIGTVLTHVRVMGRQPFIYPMFMMAAHTGARRSELLRSRVRDFDDGTVIIRERKRVRGKKSTRRVPMSSALREVMEDWFSQHPGGEFTFCQQKVTRSRKVRDAPQPITRDEAHDHFKRTLRNSKWDKMRGWHCFRHSFCSNCAMKGVDQRVIDSWVGHTTDAMRQRYRHLFPNSEQNAMSLVFG